MNLGGYLALSGIIAGARVGCLIYKKNAVGLSMSSVAECLIAFIFSTAVGLLVQRSRFCNTAAQRDAIMFKTIVTPRCCSWP